MQKNVLKYFLAAAIILATVGLFLSLAQAAAAGGPPPGCGKYGCPPPEYTLSVSKTGSGSGTVTSNPGGINCGPTCSDSFEDGTSVTLTASPTVGSTFSGWSGACSGSGSCKLSMNTNKSVTASFSITQKTLSVSKTGSGAGSGTVTSNPSGINCGPTCSAGFDYGTSVTLTASAGAGAAFADWSGEGCSGTGSCTVSMTQDRSVSANFSVTQRTLSVSKTGNGSGTVTSNPSGINCGSDCSENYDHNTQVALIAAVSSGSTFTGWSGDCSGTGNCTVTMNQSRSVTASFNKPNISLNPTSFTFSGASGGQTPAPQTMTIQNTGAAGTTLNWSGTTNQDWCHISPTSGSVSGGSSQNTSVSVDAPSNIGTFDCTITISDPAAQNSPQTAQVTYNVVNQTPTATNLSVSQPDYCLSGPIGFFSWQFTDPDPGDSQSAYRVQVDNNSNFSSPEDDSGKVNSSSQNYATPLGKLSYNTTYYWRVKVWDQSNAESNWSSGTSFTTPKHAYPDVDFSWAPSSPSQNEEVQFTDQSEVFGGAGKASWAWTFQNGNPSDSSEQNPVVKFTTSGSKNVSLEVTDTDGFSCDATKQVGVKLPLPEWKEIPPL